jgi:hypothetical protein
MSTHWIIIVGGSEGAFLFEGTEAEAEEMRKHKARQKQAVALKRPATIREIESGKVSRHFKEGI